MEVRFRYYGQTEMIIVQGRGCSFVCDQATETSMLFWGGALKMADMKMQNLKL